jgi:hypothetical protein
MDKLWEDDNCENIRSLYTAYSVPEAAARWCGVPEDSIEQVLKEIVQISSTGRGRGVYKHPQILRATDGRGTRQGTGWSCVLVF